MLNKIRFILLTALVSLAMPLGAQTYTWDRHIMDGSRTGVTGSNADNVPEALGTFKGKTYIAPNGKKFRKGAVPKVAATLLAVQDQMADVKKVIAHSAKVMSKSYPESEISNWYVDAMMDICSQKAGKKVDIGILNFGGIRVDMPEGPVLLDDIMSMFPFKNNLCYLEIRGKDIRNILEWMASSGFQAIGGVRCVAQGGKLLSATVAGEPLDDNKLYGVMTISFLLNGGDGLFIGKNAEKTVIFDEYVLDVMLPYVKRLEADGKLIDSQVDGRVQVLDADGNVIPIVKL